MIAGNITDDAPEISNSNTANTNTEEPRNKESANKENPPITTWIFSPKMLFLSILYIGNKASLAIRHEVNWALEIRYCGVPLYSFRFPLRFAVEKICI